MEFIKHTLTNEHIKQSERYLIDEIDNSANAINKEKAIDNADVITKTNTKNVTDTITRDKAVYNADGEKGSKTHTITKANTITNDNTITKAKTKTKDNIYTRIKYACKECDEVFRNKIALTTHSYSHSRKYLENAEDYINSIQLIREFYITDKYENYIIDYRLSN